MRIVLVGPVEPYRGGVSQFNTRLAETLGEEDEVLVLSWRRQFPDGLYPGGQQHATDPRTMETTRRRFELDYRSPISMARAVRRVRRWRADLVVISWTTTFSAPHYLLFLVLLRLLAVPARVIAICHNVLPHERRPGDRWLTSAVLGRCDAAVVHAAAQLDELARIAPDVPARALEMPAIGPRPPDGDRGAVREASRQTLGLGDRVVLFFGYVRPYKGLIDLIDAFALLDRSLGVELLIAGQFWEPVADHERRIRNHGLPDRVTILDRYVDDAEASRLILASDVVVLPYREATQSAVVPLARAHGRPVITTAVGGLPELVVDGVDGLLVPPRRPDLLAAAIERFYRDDLGAVLAAGAAARGDDGWSRYADGLRAGAGSSPASSDPSRPAQILTPDLTADDQRSPGDEE